MVLRESSSVVRTGPENIVGRGLVAVVDPVNWLVGGGGSEKEKEETRS